MFADNGLAAYAVTFASWPSEVQYHRRRIVWRISGENIEKGSWESIGKSDSGE